MKSTRIARTTLSLFLLIAMLLVDRSPVTPAAMSLRRDGLRTEAIALRLAPRRMILAPGDASSGIVQVWYRGGFMSTSAAVSVSDLPEGVTAAVSPDPLSHQGMADLTLRADERVRPGVYRVRLHVVADLVARSRFIDVIVTTQPDWTFVVRPAYQMVAMGSATYRVSLAGINGFHDAVDVRIAGVPIGVRASIRPHPLVPGDDATLRVTAGASAQQGRYELTISDAARTHIARVVLVVGGGGASWSAREIGSTGARNNTVLVGPGRDDGVNRVYAGTVTTGRIYEFSRDGNSWGNRVDIGGSVSGAEIHNLGMGPGRGDGRIRIYACSRDGVLYELTYTDPGWRTDTVGRDNGGDCTHAIVGDGRNDGRNRLYATRGDEVWEYTWRGAAERWRGVRVGRVSRGIAHGLALGPGRGGRRAHVYVASTGSGSWEATYEGGDWRMNRMGDSGDVRNISFGHGRDDGVVRVYAGTLQGIREFTWRNGNWRLRSIQTATGIIHTYVLPGRNDGVDRLYGAGGNGRAYEFTWTGSRWASRNLGGASDYLYGFSFGSRPGDSTLRLYGASFDESVYEFEWG
ncbi:MAG: hypothetical protein L0206_23410 [Actinobacteria bacterium]|nr:hypothetical protein [Actinomycetota bacterium]